MGALSTYYKLRMANPQVQLPGEAPVVMPYNNQQQPQQQQAAQPQQPQIDTSDPINSLAGMLVTPAEREAREQKMLQNKRRMIAWTGLFDGLRQLGNLYYTTQGATPQKYTDKPYQQIEQDYQDEVKRQDALMAHRDKYAAQLWNLQRQANEDARKKALSDAQAKWYGSREEDLKEKRRQAEEKNQAYINYYNALEEKNVEQAAYWKAKAEGYPEELASKIAKNEAQRQKALQSSGGSGTKSPYYETVKTEGFDDKGNKVTKTEKRPLKSSANQKRTGKGGSLLPGVNKNKTKQGGSLLPK